MLDKSETAISSEVKEVAPYHLEPVISHIFIKDGFMSISLEGDQSYCQDMIKSSKMAVIEHAGKFYYRQKCAKLHFHIEGLASSFHPLRVIGYYSTAEKADPVELEAFEGVYRQYLRQEMR